MIELKSIDGDPGKNLVNRQDEAIGQGTDLTRMLEHNHIDPDTVWKGYLIIAPYNEKLTRKGTRTSKTTVKQLDTRTELSSCTYEEKIVFWMRTMQSHHEWTKTGCALFLKNEEHVPRTRIRQKKNIG